MEEIIEVVRLIPQQQLQKQVVDVPMPEVVEETLGVPPSIPQDHISEPCHGPDHIFTEIYHCENDPQAKRRVWPV